MITKINKIVIGTTAMLTLASCSDRMEYKEYNVYDKDYITQNFTRIGGFMTNLYNMVDYDFGNYDYPQFALPLYNLCSNVGLYETAAITNRSNILSPKYLRLNL